ncbi:unnamed protein product [Prorocentrum cordatum]|uniref:RRM domain-containing protein n=1 Tax=Prorocentrum cordatum TaxID=2364126 RepID=A0ABN9R5M0_9DINO|nr:unnamed protein product [Polarella glacialis]
MVLYPGTDDEGEPQVKSACELWPVPAPKPKRNCARAPSAVLGPASALPSPGQRVRVILGTRPCEAKHQAATQPRITTLAVRNLHISTSQQEFLDEVNRSGFVEKYDFAYLPRNFADGSGKGMAFINFRTADAASTFAAAWHRSRRLCTKDEAGKDVPLNVSDASVQGLEANLRKWSARRVTRVKNADFLPFVLKDAEPEPMASWLEASELAAVAATNPR